MGMESSTRISPVRSESCHLVLSIRHDSTVIEVKTAARLQWSAPAHTSASVATVIMAYDEARK